MEKKKPFQKDDARASAHDQRTELVKGMVAQENAAADAKTAKLRALRLAREAADKTTVASHPTPAKPRRKRNT